MREKTILVTGGAGYIGSHTCKALKKSGYLPVTYDNLSRGHEELVKWGPLEVGDILDKDSLEATMKKYSPKAVIHFAALAYVGESSRVPADYYRNNVVGTMALLDAMRSAGVQKVVFSSSCATYGLPQELPIREDHPQNPINCYGNTKLACERMIKDYASAYGLRYVILRYFNAAGADPDKETGEFHQPETHLIPLAICAAHDDGKPLQVFGDDYATPDGTCVRDYVHVSDLGDAHVSAVETLISSEIGGLVCNIGIGHGVSVREILDAVGSVTGMVPRVEYVARRLGDPPSLVADPSYARQALKWKPKIREIVEIIRTVDAVPEL